MSTAERAEFAAFVAARWDRLVRTAYLLCGDRHEAEDLVQATLERTFASWSRVAGSHDIDAYVRRILVNTNIDRLRRSRIRYLLTAQPPARVQSDPAGDVAQRSALATALADLPPRQRAVIVLRYWEDLTEVQTADALGCAVGTVKSQAAKALAKLRANDALRIDWKLSSERT